MELKLERIYKGPLYTIGKLYINEHYFCDTLEDTDRGLSQSQSIQEIQARKLYGVTAIPTGRYLVDMNTVSSKFGTKSWAIPNKGVVPRLMDVRGFEGILIHPGNKPEDTLGCILVGLNKIKGQVIDSVTYYKKLMSKLLSVKQSEPIYITVI